MSRCWYILHTYTGYEGKIERSIRSLLEKQEISSDVILDVRVPVEEVVEIKDGKKRTRNNKFLPGYIMLEMDLPEIGWKDTCAKLYKIQGLLKAKNLLSASHSMLAMLLRLTTELLLHLQVQLKRLISKKKS